MIEQILKLLPILGLFGLIWGIVQFYQKRTYIKKDLKIKEKQISFKEIELILNNIKNEYWKLYALLTQTVLSINKRFEFSNNQINLEDQTTGIYISDIEKTKTILDNIEKEGYDKKKQKLILKEQLEISKKRENELIIAHNNSVKKLDKLQTEFNDLKSFVNSKDILLSEKIKEISKSLQTYILNLNSVSLIGIKENIKLKTTIYDLTSSIQKLINELESEENINRSNIVEILETGNLKGTMDIVIKIEEKLNE
jgi:hypothetical protein